MVIRSRGGVNIERGTIWSRAPTREGEVPDPEPAVLDHNRTMDRPPLHRRSIAAGVVGLAVVQVVVVGVFWAGFRAGASDQTNQTPQITSIEEIAPVTTVIRRDPCSPEFEQPAACIVGAALDDSGTLVIDLEYRNVDPDQLGFDSSDGVHAHMFPSDEPVESVGMPGGAVAGGGEWTITDATQIRVSSSDQDFLSRTGEVCAATATNNHTLRHLHTSCFTISR